MKIPEKFLKFSLPRTISDVNLFFYRNWNVSELHIFLLLRHTSRLFQTEYIFSKKSYFVSLLFWFISSRSRSWKLPPSLSSNFSSLTLWFISSKIRIFIGNFEKKKFFQLIFDVTGPRRYNIKKVVLTVECLQKCMRECMSVAGASSK